MTERISINAGPYADLAKVNLAVMGNTGTIKAITYGFDDRTPNSPETIDVRISTFALEEHAEAAKANLDAIIDGIAPIVLKDRARIKELEAELAETRDLLKSQGIKVTDKAIEYSSDTTPDGSFLYSKRTGRTLTEQVQADLGKAALAKLKDLLK